MSYLKLKMTSWKDQFGTGAILESTDGATYNEIKEIQDPKAQNYEDTVSNIPSLAEQLAARKAEEDEEYRQMHRNLPPKALDEEEAFFLEAIQREEQIKEDLKRKQEQKDVDSFQNEIANRVIKLNEDDAGNDDVIKPINLQMHLHKNNDNNESKEDLVIAPSVHQNDDKPKVNLDGIVLLKKVKKKKKKDKKKKKKRKDRNKDIQKIKKKDKDEDNDNDKNKKRIFKDVDFVDNGEWVNSKRRKLNLEQVNKLSEWERE